MTETTTNHHQHPPDTRTPATRATYNVDEVAQIMGLSRAGTYALVRAGDIPAIRAGNRWLIPRRRFHAWLDGEESR
jgi:excisionase family DNA binding protein